MSRLLVAGAGPDLRSHLHVRGPRPDVSGDQVVQLAEESGLTGRGGARFPLHRKLRAVRAGRRPVVVANGAEGEPASRKDAVLLDRAPHLVLDGLVHAADAVGAGRAVLYVHAGPAAGAARRAIAERRDRRTIEVVEAPPAFLSGEESAVVSRLNGLPALPRSRPPAVFEKGVGGRPTLVSNVETLAHLALVLRDGPAGFRSEGTPEEPGTMLCTVWGHDSSRNVVEIPIGSPVAAALAAGGVAADTLQALLVGGYHGAWLGADELSRVRMSAADLDPYGASPGAGVLLTLHPEHCPLRISARIVRYLADASARQCGPCLNGLPALAATLEQVADDAHPADLRRLEQLAGLVAGRGACKHPDGTVRFVRSVLRTFPRDLAAHRSGGCVSTTLTGRTWRAV